MLPVPIISFDLPNGTTIDVNLENVETIEERDGEQLVITFTSGRYVFVKKPEEVNEDKNTVHFTGVSDAVN